MQTDRLTDGWTDCRTDGQTDIASLIVAFHSFADVLKMRDWQSFFAWGSRERTASAGSQHINNEMRNIK
jgi:membrane-bound lytic murein transglycosylase B